MQKRQLSIKTMQKSLQKLDTSQLEALYADCQVDICDNIVKLRDTSEKRKELESVEKHYKRHIQELERGKDAIVSVLMQRLKK